MSVDGIDRLIHEPGRLLLVANLAVVDEADFVYLSRRTGLTSGNISSHTARLVEAGYLEMVKGYSGNRPHTTYRLTEAGRAAFESYRAAIGTLLGLRR